MIRFPWNEAQKKQVQEKKMLLYVAKWSCVHSFFQIRLPNRQENYVEIIWLKWLLKVKGAKAPPVIFSLLFVIAPCEPWNWNWIVICSVQRHSATSLRPAWDCWGWEMSWKKHFALKASCICMKSFALVIYICIFCEFVARCAVSL